MSSPQYAYVTLTAWNRIVDKLMAGQPAYTYSNICPHSDKDLCQCPKRTCFIENNKLCGTRDGVTLRLAIIPGLTDDVQCAAMHLRSGGKPRKGKKGRGRRSHSLPRALSGRYAAGDLSERER